ncbi:MAG: uracil-DNA glycosylase family protein [Thermoanaerobaculia bacterium]
MATSPVVIVGQSLCHPCMASQVPFTGGCGKLLDEAFARANVQKAALFITNVVHCHPPENRPSKDHEINNCKGYLFEELGLVTPTLVVGLGKDAERVLTEWSRGRGAQPWTPLTPRGTKKPALLLERHPAYVLRLGRGARVEFVERLSVALAWAVSESEAIMPKLAC